MRFELDLGEFDPALDGWRVLVASEPVAELGDYIAVVRVDEDLAKRMGERELRLLCLYAVAKATCDYRVAAAMLVYWRRNRVAVWPEGLERGLRRVEVRTRVRREVGWEAAFWRGACRAEALLSLDRPVVVRVEPPSDARMRERLRYRIEGARVSRKGRTRRAGGLLRRIGGRRLAPWVYVVPRRHARDLLRLVREVGGKAEVVC